MTTALPAGRQRRLFDAAAIALRRVRVLKARGRAEALLALLRARGLEVPTEIRDQILACVDIGVLDGWITRAVAAPSVQEVIA